MYSEYLEYVVAKNEEFGFDLEINEIPLVAQEYYEELIEQGIYEFEENDRLLFEVAKKVRNNSIANARSNKMEELKKFDPIDRANAKEEINDIVKNNSDDYNIGL